MKTINGDLIQLALNGEFDVIVHGCNCFHIMGAGIAAGIRKTFPEAYTADRETRKGHLDKLGQISTAEIIRGDISFTVINLYSQYSINGKQDVVYSAIRNGFELVKKKFSGNRIGYPKIGAGLAGGDWNVISPLIDEALLGEDHTLVIYNK